jgi:hypothetical protein
MKFVNQKIETKSEIPFPTMSAIFMNMGVSWLYGTRRQNGTTDECSVFWRIPRFLQQICVILIDSPEDKHL